MNIKDTKRVATETWQHS